MQDNSKTTKKQKPMNGGLIAAAIILPLTAFCFLYTAASMLFFVGDSISLLANAIALPIIAVAMLVVTVLIIMRKKATFRAVGISTILAIVLSFGVAICGMVERISTSEGVKDTASYSNCLVQWKNVVEESDWVYKNGDEVLESYSEVQEHCTNESTRPLSVTEIAAIIAQNIIFAIIPSFIAVLVWLYFRQNEETHEVLNQ